MTMFACTLDLNIPSETSGCNGCENLWNRKWPMCLAVFWAQGLDGGTTLRTLCFSLLTRWSIKAKSTSSTWMNKSLPHLTVSKVGWTHDIFFLHEPFCSSSDRNIHLGATSVTGIGADRHGDEQLRRCLHSRSLGAELTEELTRKLSSKPELTHLISRCTRTDPACITHWESPLTPPHPPLFCKRSLVCFSNLIGKNLYQWPEIINLNSKWWKKKTIAIPDGTIRKYTFIFFLHSV